MAFDCVLVANRGEIASRVILGARGLGLSAVAVYSDADRDSPHVRTADRAVRLGPAPARDSYLAVEAVIAAAHDTGAQAIHPGYGFLAENASFARACADAGITFVGPSPEVIDKMGSKLNARLLAARAQVPVIPALEDEGDVAIREQAAARVGFPLMVKAASGGGGKGLRTVGGEAELAEALKTARREARAAFGDDKLLVERRLEGARHIEVQVLGDSVGQVVHLYERDCSVQRRHQKVIEEAPAATIASDLRLNLCDAAVRLAESVGYESAGTIEFLVAGDEFYFLEMNTRLQVEHPVTELVTGIDLVEWQLRIARGERLSLSQDDITLDGHAIEARMYAEDPAQGFLPQAGTVSQLSLPPSVRVDSALEPGQYVSTHYDPMLAKFASYGSTREAARLRLLGALDHSAVFGVTTNLGLLRRLVASPQFARAEIDTAWLDQHPDRLGPQMPKAALCGAAWLRATAGADDSDPFAYGDSWRVVGPPKPISIELIYAGRPYRLAVDLAKGAIADRDEVVSASCVARTDTALVLELDGETNIFHLEDSSDELCIVHRGQAYAFTDAERRVETADFALADGVLVAPIPGTVLEVKTAPGERVHRGQTLLVMEAMKMEVAISAPFDGTVAGEYVRAGEQVPEGHVLCEVEADEPRE